MNLPPGWFPLDEAGARGMLERLRFEMPPTHALAGHPLRALARRQSNDDVLYRRLDAADRFVVVHLTWASRPETDPAWPSVEFDGGWAAFLAAERERDP